MYKGLLQRERFELVNKTFIKVAFYVLEIELTPCKNSRDFILHLNGNRVEALRDKLHMSVYTYKLFLDDENKHPFSFHAANPRKIYEVTK